MEDGNEKKDDSLERGIRIRMEIMLLRILRKKDMINGQTYEKVYQTYARLMKEVA